MSGVAVLDTTQCALGEGPLRHPGRQQFFWFDINAHRLYTRENDEARSWQFDEYVSAAEWVDAEQLIIASETALSLFDLRTGAQDRHCAVEADDPRSRNNDCRADPQGGFWIGTMCIDKALFVKCRECPCAIYEIVIESTKNGRIREISQWITRNIRTGYQE